MKNYLFPLALIALMPLSAVSCGDGDDNDDSIPVQSVSISPDHIELEPGQTQTLTLTVEPANATYSTPVWTSQNPAVASVDQSGAVKAEKAGSTSVTVALDGFIAYCDVLVSTAVSDPVAVDLGLPVKWASCNVGATKPEEFGDYFAWGEIATKNNYSVYNWYNYDTSTYTKYSASDGLKTLESADDAARANWGAPWRMPTRAEINQLLDTQTNSAYKWTWGPLNGVAGWTVTYLTNGNSIFLPAAGYLDSAKREVGSFGYYWGSSLHETLLYNAWGMKLDPSIVVGYASSRSTCYTVRPVQ